jgi:hypothetical protein
MELLVCRTKNMLKVGDKPFFVKRIIKKELFISPDIVSAHNATIAQIYTCGSRCTHTAAGELVAEEAVKMDSRDFCSDNTGYCVAGRFTFYLRG